MYFEKMKIERRKIYESSNMVHKLPTIRTEAYLTQRVQMWSAIHYKYNIQYVEVSTYIQFYKYGSCLF